VLAAVNIGLKSAPKYRYNLINFLRRTFEDRFKRYLIIALAILGVVLFITGLKPAEPTTNGSFEVHFFYLTGCSHCDEQKPFNERLAEKYPSISVIYHDASKPEGSELLSEMLASLGVDEESFFPVTIFGNQAFEGWDSEETTGEEIEKALQQCLAGDCPATGGGEPGGEIIVPIIGKIVPSEYSLPALAIILGIVDGFNPCAMWVLVYLISLVMTLKDRRRIWLIVGSFVFASGVLYYLFMAVWLNAFLVVGYFRPLTIVIGLVAFGAGIVNEKEFIQTKGAIVCEVEDEESRRKTMSRVERLIRSPLNLGMIAGIIALAFVVNSIEFVCSAAIPAVFTHVLSLRDLSTFQYYGYILLYDIFFMLDDLVIFGSAAFAMNSNIGGRYSKYGKPIGGAILLALGALLLFAPDLLR
jgi:thiol-disulfide isomerase/thioredoxin